MNRRRAAGVLSIFAAAFTWQAMRPAAVGPRPNESVAIDLSAGSLSQSNCQTSLGCGHPNVKIAADSFVSSDTAASPAQHILTLQFSDPLGTVHGKRPYTLEVEYEFSNPSGRKNNLLCASALVEKRLVQRCANTYSKSGYLRVPVNSSPDKVALQFGLMPNSRGHRFAVKNMRLVFGRLTEQTSKPKGDGIDVAAGRLSQTGCATPIGCAHSNVIVTPTSFSSFAARQNEPQPPPPDDNPQGLPVQNPQPVPAGKLSLEMPAPVRGKSSRSLRFAYRLEGAGAQAGARIAITATGRTIVESTITTAGSGIAGIDLPETSLPIDTVTVAFIPAKDAAPVDFAVSDLGLGPHLPADATPLAAGESTTCASCDPPASRFDPCGAFLHTFWVSAADSREGRGIRCVSSDLRAWYGEGWWIDPDVGRYRHLGYVHEQAFGLPSGGLAVDFGVISTVVPGDEFRPAYGTRGPQILRIEPVDAERLHVFTDSHSVDEVWTFVPKGELLPAFFGSLPWDGECGGFGLHQFDAMGEDVGFARRCTMPADLRIRSDDWEHTSLPLVWYGGSYLSGVPRSFEFDRPHLGWLVGWPIAPSRAAVYAAADRCVVLSIIPCSTFDSLVSIELLGPGVPLYPPGSPQRRATDSWFRERQGLYIVGPGTWLDGDGHIWERLRQLPPDAALPAPTAICVGADCP